MDNDLKDIVQEMIDKGYKESEIAIAIKRHQNQQELKIQKKRIIKKKIDKKDIFSKILASIIIGFFSWFIIMIIAAIICDIVNTTFEVEIIALIAVLISIYPIYKTYSYVNYNNTIKKIINSNLLFYALELIFPAILTSLFYLFAENKDIRDEEIITGLVSFVFFFVLLLEWIRRKKDTKNRSFYFKFAYIVLMLIIFILGVWYVNELNPIKYKNLYNY